MDSLKEKLEATETQLAELHRSNLDLKSRLQKDSCHPLVGIFHSQLHVNMHFVTLLAVFCRLIATIHVALQPAEHSQYDSGTMLTLLSTVLCLSWNWDVE